MSESQLVRRITLISAITLVVSSIIGSGVYKKAAKMSFELGSPKLVIAAWIVAGIISLFGALSNAEIASMMADSGGEYVYFRRIYGRFMSFMFGWSIFSIIKTASVSSIAYVFSESLNNIYPLGRWLPESVESFKLYIFPAINNVSEAVYLEPFANSGVKGITILLILLLTYLNTRGLKGGEFFSNWITRLVIIGLTLIVLFGIFSGAGSVENLTSTSATVQFTDWKDFTSHFFLAMLAAFWGYEGWNTVGFLGGEIQNPNKNLPLALFSGLMIVMAAYILVNLTYHYLLSIDDLIAVKNGQNQIAAVAAVSKFGGQIGGKILSLIILITTLGCTNSTILMPPRMYYAMAKDGLFFPSAAKIDPKTKTPNNALWMQGIWACLLVMSGSFEQLTEMLIFAAFFFYGATALGVFILRVREPNADRPYKTWGYPIVPLVFILFCIVLIINTLYQKPIEAGKGLALMLTGIPFYLYWTRKK